MFVYKRIAPICKFDLAKSCQVFIYVIFKFLSSILVTLKTSTTNRWRTSFRWIERWECVDLSNSIWNLTEIRCYLLLTRCQMQYFCKSFARDLSQLLPYLHWNIRSIFLGIARRMTKLLYSISARQYVYESEMLLMVNVSSSSAYHLTSPYILITKTIGQEGERGSNWFENDWFSRKNHEIIYFLIVLLCILYWMNILERSSSSCII